MNMKMTGKRLCWWLTLGCCLVTVLAMSQTASAQEKKPAAEVIALVGTAEIKSPSDPNFRPAQLQAVLYPQDQIRTLANSRAKLFCADETILTLGENTTVDLAKLQMDQQGRRQSALVKILDGSMRFIVHKFYAGLEPNFEIQGKTVVMGIRGTDGVFETRNPDTVYFLSGRTTLNLRNMTTGQTVTLTPRNFAATEPGRPFRTGVITPEIQNRLMKYFQAAQSHVPSAVITPPPPPSLLSASQRAGITFGNPAIPQSNNILNTNNPATIQGGTLQPSLATTHSGLLPR